MNQVREKLDATKSAPLFTIGNVPVYGDAILAPMAGYSDVPYRALCRAFGSAMNYTEFVPVESLLGRRIQPRMRMRLDKKPGEHPMVFQIFGNNAQLILDAALRIEAWEPDIIDINMGCSTRKVSGRGAGAGMMPQPKLVEETFNLLSTHLSVPVTGKIRLGWDSTQRNYREIANIMVENGAALVSMHGRTKQQKYGGQADWDAIAELRQAVPVPVIGNGDVKCVADIQRMKEHTGCDAVMIGRAAIGNPWIFSGVDKSDVSFEERLSAIRIHVREMASYYGEPHGLLQFRKHLKRYVEGIEACEPFVARLLMVETLGVFEQILNEMEESILWDVGQPAKQI